MMGRWEIARGSWRRSASWRTSRKRPLPVRAAWRCAPGRRHFAAGAKVWVLPPQWGDGGDQLIVAGHHRGTRGRRGLARMVMPRRHLTGFRVQGVYSPAVIRALTRPLTELGSGHAPRLWATRQQAEATAAAWRALPLAAHADDWSFTTVVAGPAAAADHPRGPDLVPGAFQRAPGGLLTAPAASRAAGRRLTPAAGDVPPPSCPRAGSGPGRHAAPGRQGRVPCLSVCLRGRAAPYAAGLPRFTIWSDAAGACGHSER